MAEMRIQKFLSQAGVASRRHAEELIEAGKVKVNNKVCKELGTKIDPDKDKIEVDGRIIDTPSSLIYLLVNKPQGYITTLDDPEGRPIITDLLPANMPRVWPVGRLDWDSDGAVLMTNDGELTNFLTHPSHDIEKTYAVKIQAVVEEEDPALIKLRQGVEIDEDLITLPAVVKVGRTMERNTWLEFRIKEGRNRQIRRMCEAVGFRVSRLRRIAIGPLSIKGLPSGHFRALDFEEVRSLYNAVGESPPEAAEASKRARKREAKERRFSNTAKARRVSNAKAAAEKKEDASKTGAKTARPPRVAATRPKPLPRDAEKPKDDVAKAEAWMEARAPKTAETKAPARASGRPSAKPAEGRESRRPDPKQKQAGTKSAGTKSAGTRSAGSKPTGSKPAGKSTGTKSGGRTSTSKSGAKSAPRKPTKK